MLGLRHEGTGKLAAFFSISCGLGKSRKFRSTRMVRENGVHGARRLAAIWKKVGREPGGGLHSRAVSLCYKWYIEAPVADMIGSSIHGHHIAATVPFVCGRHADMVRWTMVHS